MSKIERRLWRILTGGLLVALPFGPALPNILSGLMLAFWGYQLAAGKIQIRKKNSMPFLIINGFVFFHVFSVLWSQNIPMGLAKSATLLLIPALYLVLSTNRAIYGIQEIIRLILLFTLGMTVLSVGSLAVAIGTGGLSVSGLAQQALSTAWIDFHYLGFSVYVGLCIVLNSQLLIFHNESLLGWVRKVLPFLLIFLGGILILLSSRTTIAVTLLLLGLQFVFGWKRRQLSAKAFMIATVSTAVLVSIGLSNRVLTDKLKEAINLGDQYRISEYWGGRGFRQLIWNCASHVIWENPFFGVGYGDQKDALDLCYREHRYQALLYHNNNFNAHNVFLQAAVATGIFGLLLFIAAFLYPAFIAVRRSQWLYLVFLVMILGTGLTESHFNRNAMVSLFAILNPILFLIQGKSDENSPTS